MSDIKERVECRDSSFELLRIVAMLFIIAQHLLLFVVYTPKEHNTIQVWYINSFLYIGANVFILISGYFGIKPKFNTFINLYLCIAFYKCVGYLWDTNVGAIDFSMRDFIVNSVFCISHSGNWFIEGYIFLFLLSPILNMAIERFDKKTLLFIIGLLTVSNLYFGYFWKLETFNLNGYNGHQFVYLYFIGHYISKFIDKTWIATNKWCFLLAYIVCTVLYIILIGVDINSKIPHWDHWKYNNPLLLISTISFFMFFCGMKVKSRWVNFLASFSFPAFLLHICPVSFYKSVKEISVCANFMGEGTVLFIFGCAIIVYIMTIPVELIRQQMSRYCLMFYDYLFLNIKK